MIPNSIFIPLYVAPILELGWKSIKEHCLQIFAHQNPVGYYR